ncbi:MAG: DUF983 domain-containing protein [Bacillota bacterium]
MEERARRNWWRALWDGWRNRCPECRKGRIWKQEGTINDRCSNCGLQFEPDKADWGGFTYAYAVEGILIGVGIVLVELFFDLAFITHVYLWVAFIVIWHILFYRNMKGQWIALRTVLSGRPDNRV